MVLLLLHKELKEFRCEKELATVRRNEHGDRDEREWQHVWTFRNCWTHSERENCSEEKVPPPACLIACLSGWLAGLLAKLAALARFFLAVCLAPNES